jgi:hypothetical protein
LRLEESDGHRTPRVRHAARRAAAAWPLAARAAGGKNHEVVSLNLIQLSALVLFGRRNPRGSVVAG